MTACVFMAIASSCGDNKKTISVDSPVEGRGGSMITEYIKLEPVATYSYVNTDGAISRQDWLVEIPFEVIQTVDLGVSAEALAKELGESFVLDIYDENGEAISGQKGYTVNEKDMVEFLNSLKNDPGTIGTLKFTHYTNNKDAKGDWFDNARSAKITIDRPFGTGTGKVGTNSTSITVPTIERIDDPTAIDPMAKEPNADDMGSIY